MKKLLFLPLIILLQTAQGLAQVKINLSDGFNGLKKMGDYETLMKEAGKANAINKDAIDQLFCGMTRGQDIHFLYTKFGINVTARKGLGYVSRKEIGRGYDYYKNAQVNDVVISGNSPVKLNNVVIDKIDLGNIKEILGEPGAIDSTDTWIVFVDSCEMTDYATTTLANLKQKENKTGDYIQLPIYAYQDKTSGCYFNFYFAPEGKLAFIHLTDFDFYISKKKSDD